jgi:SpoVK/Ycf46/Vps4 family AAA+-type ATPase
MVVQAALVVFMAALFINVVVSVVAILSERDAADPADGRARRFASELEPQRPARAAPVSTTQQPASESPSERVPAKQTLSER